jgi:hypothetical protein
MNPSTASVPAVPIIQAPSAPVGVTLCLNRTEDPGAPWFDPKRPVQQFRVDPSLLDLKTPGATWPYNTLGIDATGKPGVVAAPPILCTRAAVENVPGLPTVQTYAQWLAARPAWGAVAVGGQGGVSPLPKDGGFTPSEAAALAQDILTNCPGVTSCVPVPLSGPVGNTSITYSYPANDARRVFQIIINGQPFNMGDGEGDTASDGLFQVRAAGGIDWPGTWAPYVSGQAPKFNAESFSDYGTTAGTQVTPLPVAPLLPGQIVVQNLYGGFSIENTSALPASSSGGGVDLAPVIALLASIKTGMNVLLGFFRFPTV